MSARSTRTSRLRPVLIATVLLASLLATTSALASHTPNPTSVTVAGSLQQEAGCPGDWDPACAATHLAFDANDTVWQGTFTPSAGNYEVKVAINESWDENYGAGGVQNGPNIAFTVAADCAETVFSYNATTHVLTVSAGSGGGGAQP